jgi:hypothetical protein
MAKKVDPTKTPKVGIKAKNLSTKEETRANSARLSSIKPKKKGQSGQITDTVVSRTTYPSGTTSTKRKVSIPGVISKDKYSYTRPKRK